MAKKDFTLLDDFELKGWWWLPEKPKDLIAGILKFTSNDNISLELMGAFGVETDAFGGNLFETEIIHGIAENGKAVTLFINSESQRNIRMPGNANSLIISRYIFLGKHFHSSNSIRFSSIQANFTNLEEWMVNHPFHSEHEKDKLTASCTLPLRFKARINSLNAVLESAYTVNQSGDGFRTFEWIQERFIRLTPSHNNDFDWFLRKLHDIKNLLCLFINVPIYIKKIVASGDKITKTLNSDIMEIEERIEVFFIQFGQVRPNIKDKVHPLSMPFNLQIISKYIHTVFELWFCNSVPLRSVYDLYFGFLYNQGMYVEFLFLSLVQALESFHRIKMGGKYLNNYEYKQFKDIMISSIPLKIKNNHRDSLKAKIKYGNEYSLRKRISEILNTMNMTINQLNISNHKIVNIIVDTRNYLTHYDEGAADNSLPNVDIFYAIQLLNFILTILLLRETGLKEEMLINRLFQNQKIQHYLENIKLIFK